MRRLWLSFNGEEQIVELPVGHSWDAELSLSSGEVLFTAWCQNAPIALMIRSNSFEVLDQQWGHVVTASIAVEKSVCLFISLSVNRQVCSTSDAKLIDEATEAMRNLATRQKPGLGACAASLLRASRLTTRVATFLTEDDEFCVIKRKLLTKGKKIPLPRVWQGTDVVRMMAVIQRGEKRWKQSSGSFSTMMRFIQRSREEFQWESREEQTATMVSALEIPT